MSCSPGDAKDQGVNFSKSNGNLPLVGTGDAPLGFYENSSRTDRLIVTKLGIPNLLTILHLP